ncbi:MAG: hypothetical protein ACFCU2_03310, partial [Acidimicrobiia bacterium]
MNVDRAVLAKWSGFVAIGLMVVYFLAVNTHPIITNDSLEYLDHSRDPGAFGVVFKGYKQIGYPIALMVERWVAGLVGVESLLFSAIVQRLILAGALGYAVWLWRWKATPLVLLVLTPGFLIYPNFILTEGLSVPLSLLLACLVGHFFHLTATKASHKTDPVTRSKAPVTVAALATFVVFALITFRFPLAVFGLVPVIILATAIRSGLPSRRTYLTILLLFLLAGGTFTAALAVENRNEHGVLSPSTLGKPTQFWGAWRLTFVLNSENQGNPRLDEFYDGGTPHPRIARAQSENPEYRDQAESLEADIMEMLDLAGLDRNRERVFAMAGALRGGRIDDLRSYTETALRSDARSIDEAINRNTFTLNNGVDAFTERYSDGLLPQSIITSPAFPQFPAPNIQTMLKYLLPLALIGSVALTVLKRLWLPGLAYLAPVVVLSLAMGWMLLDNVRFVLPGSVFGIAGFCALWALPRLVAP